MDGIMTQCLETLTILIRQVSTIDVTSLGWDQVGT